jgi:hypothetical protein
MPPFGSQENSFRLSVYGLDRVHDFAFIPITARQNFA